MTKHGKTTLLAVCAFAVGFFHIVSNDIWWHLATGAWMAQNFAVPSTDPFSYTTLGESWVYHNWLFDLPLHFVEKLWGLRGLVILRALLVTLLGLSVYRLLNLRISPAWAAVLTMLVLGAVRVRFFLRPHLAAFILFAVLFAILVKLYDEKKIRLKSPAFLSAPIIIFIWANMHASAIFGIFLIATFAVSAIIRRKERAPFLILLCASFVVGLANPNFFNLYVYPFKYLALKGSLPFVNEEHLPPPGIMREPQLLMFWLITYAGVALFLLRIKKAEPYLLMLYVAFGWLAFTSMRGIAFFSIVNMFAVASLWPRGAGARLGRKKYVVLPAILTPLIAVGAIYTQPFEMKFGVASDTAPISAVDFVERVGMKGDMFNSHPFGGYLIYRFYPERKVFIDGRDLLHAKTMRLINDLGYPAALNIFNVEWIIAGHRDGILKRIPQNEWELIFFDDLCVVLAKKGGVNKDIIEKYAYRAITPFDIEEKIEKADAKQLREIKKELSRAINSSKQSSHLLPLLKRTFLK